MLGRRRRRGGPYMTRFTTPRGISYSSGMASGRACARYGLLVLLLLLRPAARLWLRFILRLDAGSDEALTFSSRAAGGRCALESVAQKPFPGVLALVQLPGPGSWERGERGEGRGAGRRMEADPAARWEMG